MPLLPPPPEPICRGRARNRSAETDGDRTAQDKQGGGLDHQPQAGVLWPFSGVQGLAPWALFASFLALEIVKSSAKKNGRKFQQEISRKGTCEVCDLAYG